MSIISNASLTWDPGAEGADAVDGAASAAVEKLLPLPGASGTYGSVVPICAGTRQGQGY